MLRHRTYLRESADVDITFKVKILPFEKKLYGVMIRYLLRKLKVSGIKVVVRKKVMKRAAGYINLKDNHGKTFELFINANTSYRLAARYLAHEIVHIKQVVQGNLSKEGSSILWKGRVVSDYRSYLTRDVHDSMPFEKEAKDGERIADSFWKSKDFKQAAKDDASIAFIFRIENS